MAPMMIQALLVKCLSNIEAVEEHNLVLWAWENFTPACPKFYSASFIGDSSRFRFQWNSLWYKAASYKTTLVQTPFYIMQWDRSAILRNDNHWVAYGFLCLLQSGEAESLGLFTLGKRKPNFQGFSEKHGICAEGAKGLDLWRWSLPWRWGQPGTGRVGETDDWHLPLKHWLGGGLQALRQVFEVTI